MTINEYINNYKFCLSLYRQVKLVDQIVGAKYFRSVADLVEYVNNTYIDKETSVWGEQLNIYTYAIYVSQERI